MNSPMSTQPVIKGPATASKIGFRIKKPIMACLYHVGEEPKKLCQNACRTDSCMEKPCIVINWGYYGAIAKNDDVSGVYGKKIELIPEEVSKTSLLIEPLEKILVVIIPKITEHKDIIKDIEKKAKEQEEIRRDQRLRQKELEDIRKFEELENPSTNINFDFNDLDADKSTKN